MLCTMLCAPQVLSGWMTKQGGKRKNWQKRWFEIRGCVRLNEGWDGDGGRRSGGGGVERVDRVAAIPPFFLP